MFLQQAHNKMQARVVAVVVTFNADPAALEALLKAVRGQVETVVLVDNGSGAKCLAFMRALCDGAVHLLPLGENLGVAAAHNRGIKWARERNATHVLQLDHDSVPGEGMVFELLHAESSLLKAGKKVAAVGPLFSDSKHGAAAPFIRRSGPHIQRLHCSRDGDLIEADYLITSGSLIPLSVLDQCGGLDEGLFIDYVDIEWGLRAQSKGFRCYGVCAAKMAHDLGDRTIPIAGSRRITVHAPLRHYYLFRNATLLYRRSYIDWRWKLNDFARMLAKYVFFSLFASPRLRHLQMMTRGIRDGLLGRDGRFD